jgi:hypothetical protein
LLLGAEELAVSDIHPGKIELSTIDRIAALCDTREGRRAALLGSAGGDNPIRLQFVRDCGRF